MKIVTVYHPSGRTELRGVSVDHTVVDGGTLMVRSWRGETVLETARFAAGHWGFVRQSEHVPAKEELATRVETLIGDAREEGLSDEAIIAQLTAAVDALKDGLS